MKILRPLAITSLVLITGACMASNVPKQWQKIYEKINETIVRNDVHSYMQWMDKDFVNIQRGQKTRYAAYEKMFTDFMKPFSNIKAKAAPVTFKKDGKNVVIAFHYTFSGDLNAKGKTKTVRFFEDGIDKWHKVAGRYLQFEERITKDGLLPS